MSDSRAVAVIGGGIVGAFAACFLAERGIRVALIERDGIGRQASGNNPGGLNPLYGPGIPGPMEGLALDSLRLHRESWPKIRTRSGSDFLATEAVRIHIAMDEEDVERLEPVRRLYDSVDGFSAEWVDRPALLRAEPRLHPDLRKGLRTTGNSKVDPASYAPTVAAAAASQGASIIADEVCGLDSENGRVREVLLKSGSLPVDGLIVATGPWVSGPAEWLGLKLPVEPVKGELLTVRPERPLETDFAWRDAAAYGGNAGEVWLGGTEERVGFDLAPTDAGRGRILERIGRFLPGLRESPIRRHVAALRPMTPDGRPIIGLAKGWENVCLALGAGRKGMLFGSGMGRAAADLIVEGETGLDVAACAPERFA